MTYALSFRPMPGFMFRIQELARIKRVLAKGQSVLLVGIRNTGKTQLMKAALTAHAQAHPDAGVAYLDVSTLIALDAFYRQLLAAMPKRLLTRAVQLLEAARQLPDALMQWLRKHVDQAEGFGVSINLNEPQQLTRYWEPLLAALEKAVAESAPAELPLIGIDELPFMLENLLSHQVSVADITVMLAGLRKLRSAGLRMILGGSISMENLLVLNNIPDTVLGQLWREEAPPFSRSEAKQYLARELAGHPALAHTTAVMALLPDLVPSHLDAAVNMLADAEVSSASEVELVMTNQVLPNIRRSFLQQFDERLAKHYPDEELRTAQDLLDQVARLDESGGTIDSTGLPMHWRRVLTKLQYDMFLRDAPGLGYRFSLNLLRQWWRATRGM